MPAAQWPQSGLRRTTDGEKQNVNTSTKKQKKENEMSEEVTKYTF